MYCNARQEASYHWCRQQVRDPAELEDPSDEQHHADKQGECCGGRSDRGGASRGEGSQRSCEYRRYGRVSAGRQNATCAYGSKADSCSDEGIKPDLWLKAPELCRGHLFWDGDGRERQSGNGIPGDIILRPALKRTEQDSRPPPSGDTHVCAQTALSFGICSWLRKVMPTQWSDYIMLHALAFLRFMTSSYPAPAGPLAKSRLRRNPCGVGR